MNDKPYKFQTEIKFECPSLIVGWNDDAGNLGSGIMGYLKDKLKCLLLAEIEPTGFFPLNGVQIVDDVALFPKSRLYYCPGKELLLFESDTPHSDWYRFINTVLDMAQFSCRLSDVYTIGGMVSLNAHTAGRSVMAVAGTPEVKVNFLRFDVDSSMNYETPEGQRPTLSSYLVWVAAKRDIQGAAMWVPVPFYLSAVDDKESWRALLKFFDKRFGLDLDFADLDIAVTTQNDKLSQARESSTELDGFLDRLETNQALSQDENDKLMKDIEEILG